MVSGDAPNENLAPIGFTSLFSSSLLSVEVGDPNTNPAEAGFMSLLVGAPNEKFAIAVGFFSSLSFASAGLAPNWNVAAAAIVSLGLNPKLGSFVASLVSLVLSPLGMPKLNPVLSDVWLPELPPKVNPFVFGRFDVDDAEEFAASSALSMPNLKLPAFAGMSTLICRFDLDLATSLPAFGVSQAMHLVASDLFDIMQVSHVQEPSGFLNLSPKPLKLELVKLLLLLLLLVVVVFAVAPGFGVSQAAHLLASALFWIMQTSHDHEPSGFLNLSPNPEVIVAVTGVLVTVRLGLMFTEPGLAVWQHGQVITESTLCTMQQGHSHELLTDLKVLIGEANDESLLVFVDVIVAVDGLIAPEVTLTAVVVSTFGFSLPKLGIVELNTFVLGDDVDWAVMGLPKMLELMLPKDFALDLANLVSSQDSALNFFLLSLMELFGHSMISISESSSSLGFILLHAMQCFSLLLFLMRHSLHSQTPDESFSTTGFFEKKSITLPVLSSLATFGPFGDSSSFTCLGFSLGFRFVCEGPAQMKLGNEGVLVSESFELTLSVFDNSCESFKGGEDGVVTLLGEIGLLKVKLLMDSRLFAPSVSLIGLANLNGLSLSDGDIGDDGGCCRFIGVLKMLDFVLCGNEISKRGRLDIGRGTDGRFRASMVSCSSRLVFFLALSEALRFGSGSTSVLNGKSKIVNFSE